MTKAPFTIWQKASLLWSMYRDKRTPWFIKALPLIAVLYGVSPIDLIPDFIPIAGQLDDIGVIITLLFAAYSMIPKDFYREHRERVKVEPL